MKTAYPNLNSGATLTLFRNVPFDNTYKHHTLISNLFKYNDVSVYTAGVVNACDRLLEVRKPSGSHDYYFPRDVLTGTYNFDYSNGLITKITLELTPAQTNANYMKVVCGNDTYYYFITGIKQENFDTYQLTLELDVLMTYQDEFLNGMYGKPVLTERKHSHRFTSTGLIPYCADYKTGDSAFNGIKPSIPTNFKQLHFMDTNMLKLEGVMWLYVCCDMKKISDVISDNPMYSCKGKYYPVVRFAGPLNVNITYQKMDGTATYTHTKSDVIRCIKQLINNGSIHGCKLSPYPPFSLLLSLDTSIIRSDNDITIKFTNTTKVGTTDVYKVSCGNNKFYYGAYDEPNDSAPLAMQMLGSGFVLLTEQNDTTYRLDMLNVGQFASDMKLGSALTITSNRFEPKILFAPFRKYVLGAQYSSDAYELYPELQLSSYPVGNTAQFMGFTSYATGYIGDTNFYTEVVGSATYTTYKNYKYEKIGLATSVNYIIPTGEDALKVFNTTQAQSFYTSKIASGITSGLTIAGGVGSIIAGTTITATGGPTGVGMIVGGATAISGGVASFVNNIKESQAKLEDLKNTPASVNISGSNFTFDDVVLGEDTHCLPYILTYEVPQVIKDRATDYFYQYGYQVARCCYFNTELKVDLTQNKFVDNNLFGRTIFNYIKINEDITNKIDADIPMIIKQKLSSIFNAGITLWSFFGFSYLWGSNYYPQFAEVDWTDYFLKMTKDNTEYNG